LEADTRGRTLQGYLDGRRLFIGLADDAAAGTTTLQLVDHVPHDELRALRHGCCDRGSHQKHG
jgi:hypothetical protein